jgi:hypothetical protein
MNGMMNDDKPSLLAFVSDLMFTTRIANGAKAAGFDVVWLEDAAVLGEKAQNPKPGESLYGQEGALFTQISRLQPALLLFDLTNAQIPWRKWIPRLKSSPATRRIPILCFGPHMDVDEMQLAKKLGADVVVARSKFFGQMVKLFEENGRIPDHNALHNICQQPLPAPVKHAIDLFNQGKYYECHDNLEAAWRDDPTPGRELYRGILQAGIAFYQIQRGNYRGAVKMLLRVNQWLSPLPDACRGIDIASLRQNIQQVHDILLNLGEEQIDTFDTSLFQPIRYENKT